MKTDLPMESDPLEGLSLVGVTVACVAVGALILASQIWGLNRLISHPTAPQTVRVEARPGPTEIPDIPILAKPGQEVFVYDFSRPGVVIMAPIGFPCLAENVGHWNIKGGRLYFVGGQGAHTCTHQLQVELIDKAGNTTYEFLDLNLRVRP